MKLLVCALLLGALAASAADAGPFAPRSHSVLGGGITVPPEWAGIWQSTDTTDDCNGVFVSTSTSLDTLCTGQTFEDDDPNVSCTGSADANSYTQHCTGTSQPIPDCTATFDILTNGTRTGDSFFSVTVFQASYSGTGKGCDLFPDFCQQFNSHSIRIAPAPAEYCATPVEGLSWGRVKSLYR
jgi:hypothetical protein